MTVRLSSTNLIIVFSVSVSNIVIFVILLLFLLFILSNNVLDATKTFAIVLTDRQDVVGLPNSLLKLTAEAASADASANLEVSRYK